MSGENTISQWLTALMERQWGQMRPPHDTDAPGSAIPADVQWHDQATHPLYDVLQVLLQPPAEAPRLSDSLAVPSPMILSPLAQHETNQLLADILRHVSENSAVPHQDTASVIDLYALSAAVTPFGQESEMGDLGGLAIYNAAFLPGWPLTRFEKNPETQTAMSPQAQAQQDARNEADIVAYLAGLGLNQDMLSKVLKTFKTTAERIGFLVWLSAFVTIATNTLTTLRNEAVDPFLDGPDDDTPGMSKKRGFLRI